jgi:DNA-binding beta-propeller fold protein YncE
MNIRANTAAGASADQATSGRLFVLSLSEGVVLSMNPDGSDRTTIASGGHMPDGVAVDAAAGHVYWTNMGVPHLDDGTIERCDLDGGNRITIIPQGVTHTPKQLHLDRENRKLYWGDREGMRMMRCSLDGSQVETLVVTGDVKADRGDQTKWCVGVTIDHAKGQLYWTQKGSDNAGQGRIFRVGLEIPPGETAASRSDVELWCDGLPEPIDLEFDPVNRLMYWTDRGDPPVGNTVNRAAVDSSNPAPELLISHLMEGIGLALDLAGGRMFVTDLGGSVYAARLDGAEARPIAFAQGNLSGVAYVELPPKEG